MASESFLTLKFSLVRRYSKFRFFHNRQKVHNNLNVKWVLSENIGGILGGTQC
jgi:hypothetical protein